MFTVEKIGDLQEIDALLNNDTVVLFRNGRWWRISAAALSGGPESSAAHAQAAAQSALDADGAKQAAITALGEVQQAQQDVDAKAASAGNAVAGVTADANAAKVLLTAASGGDIPPTYKGYWNASANSPALVSGTGTEGDLYIVSVAGTTALDGNASWSMLDGAWYHNGSWQYFARAGWAAVAQTITAVSALALGTGAQIADRLGDGLSLTDAIGFLFAQLDGSGLVVGPADAPTVALQPGLVDTGDFKLVAGSSGAPLTLVDALGFVIATVTGSGLSIGTGEHGPNVGLSSGQITAGSLAVVDGDSAVRGVDALGFSGGAPAAVQPPSIGRPDRREPQGYDDAQALYAVGDLWGHDGLGWVCQDVYPQDTLWSPLLDAQPLPGDVFGTDIVAAYGTTPMIAGFTGAAIDVATVRSGVISTTTINILADGRLDMATLGKTLLGVDSGTFGYVVRVYDQTGNGNHMVPPTYAATLTTAILANCPHVGVRVVNGVPAISYTMDGLTPQRTLQIPSTVSVSAGAMSWCLIGRVHTSNADAYTHCSLGGIGGVGGTDNGVRFNVGNYTQAGVLGFSVGGWANSTASKTSNSNAPGMMLITGAGSDEIGVTTAKGSTDLVSLASGFSDTTLTGGYLGAYYDSSQSNSLSPVQMTGLVVAKRAATTADILALRSCGVVNYGWRPQVRRRFLAIGDSVTAGSAINDCWSWPQFLGDFLAVPRDVYNIGVPGGGARDYMANTSAQVLALIAKDETPVDAHVWYGTNDLNETLTVAETVTYIAEICTSLRTAGVEIITVNSVYDATLSSAIQQAIALGTIDADGYIDILHETPFLDYQSSSDLFAPGGSHMLPTGLRIVASRYARLLNAITESKGIQ